MPEANDHELLARFARENSETAFAALVGRHVALVYSVALRRVGNPHAAEEITQAVFIILARKAKSLSAKTILPGWFHQTARLTAANHLRAEIRRRQHEQEAYMQTILTESAHDETWRQLAPQLDDAIAKLRTQDRDALILRYFENKSLREVGDALGLEERAAQKRVNRAVEKLRHYFSKRGIGLTTAIIAGAISANSVQAAPVGLATTITATVLKGSTVAASTLTLVKGTLNLMAWSKAKTAIVAGVVVLFVAGTVATGSRFWFANDDEIRFEAEGTLIYKITPDSRGSYTDTKHFIVAKDGKFWKIRTITEKQERTGLGGPIGGSVDLYFEMGFDGTNIYTLDQQDFGKVKSGFDAKTIQSGKYISALGRVEKADSPPSMDIYKLYPVWLAYCSAPYFKNLNGDKAVSPTFATRDFLTEAITRKQQPAKWDFNNRCFLKTVSWFSDGNVEAHWPDGRTTIEKYQPPYDRSFVETHFEILSWTNWNNISVPNSFKIITYRPDYTSTNVARFKVAYTITGTLEQIRTINKFSPVPELTTRTLITDLRIKQTHHTNPPVSYVSTNHWDFSGAIR